MKDALFPPWSSAIGFFLGAFFGSFLNMVIYRLPRELSFGEPKRSFCPNCEHSLDWIDLFPIFSWLSTGGKCRYCKKPIAPRYLIVELVTGLLFAGVWYRYMCQTANPMVLAACINAFIVCCLVAIIFIDAEHFIIPDEINAALLIGALVFQGTQGHWMDALWGALLGWGLIWGIALIGRLMFGKDAMGDGDIKMMRGIGALIGWKLLLANIGIAVVLGLIGGLIGMAIAPWWEKRQAAEAARRRAEAAANGEDVTPEPDAELKEPPTEEPTPIPIVLLSGVWYLLCLDVFTLFIPPLQRWVDKKFPEEKVDEKKAEEEKWKPGPTAIPFGPYLAAGALLCMLFGSEISVLMQDYWNNATGNHPAYGNGKSRFVRVEREAGSGFVVGDSRSGG